MKKPTFVEVHHNRWSTESIPCPKGVYPYVRQQNDINFIILVRGQEKEMAVSWLNHGFPEASPAISLIYRDECVCGECIKSFMSDDPEYLCPRCR